jgi:hypothetical protein
MAGFVSGAIVGSAVIGGLASSSAAAKQAGAAKNAAALQQQQYEQTRQDQMPWMRSGEGALNRLNELLGIAPSTAVQNANAPQFIPQFDEAAYLKANPDVAQQVALNNINSGLYHYKKYGQQEGRAMPMTVDPNAAAAAAPRGADFGKYARDFSMQDFQTDPGAKRREEEAKKTLISSYAARGGLLSGGAGKALIRFSQDYASDDYQNAFNRYQVNRSNQLAPLQAMAGMGQTTAQQLGNAGANYATNAGNAYGAAGQAAASGIMGGANAISQGVGQYVNYNQGNSLIAALNRGGTPSGYGAVVPVGANQYTG